LKPATPFLAAAERYRPVDDLVDSVAWYAAFAKTYLSSQTKAEAT
jgi:hypothetical protein